MSNRETFFHQKTYAVVGDTERKAFPRLTYGGLKAMGKSVYPVDLGGSASIEGDPAFAGLDKLPTPVDAVVVEVPRDETLAVVERVAEAGIKHVWIHQGCDTPQVLDFCREHGVNARHGSCAVMYTGAGSYHRVHRGLLKLFGKY